MDNSACTCKPGMHGLYVPTFIHKTLQPSNASISMVKVRTVVPMNAKPEKSVIQVMNPKTNKPSRVKVAANAQPGQVVELDLPDEPVKLPPPSNTKDMDRSITTATQKRDNPPANTEATSGGLSQKPKMKAPTKDLDSRSLNSAPQQASSSSLLPVARVPPPTQLPTPPRLANITQTRGPEVEKQPLIPKHHVDDANDRAAGISCCDSTARFFRSSCGTCLCTFFFTELFR